MDTRMAIVLRNGFEMGRAKKLIDEGSLRTAP